MCIDILDLKIVAPSKAYNLNELCLLIVDGKASALEIKEYDEIVQLKKLNKALETQSNVTVYYTLGKRDSNNKSNKSRILL